MLKCCADESAHMPSLYFNVSRMSRCPHCRQPGLRSLDLAFSTAWAPARCRLCGDEAYSSLLFRLASAFVTEFLLYAAAVLALIYWSWWPFALLLVAMIGLQLASLAMPAIATAPRRSNRWRWAHRGFLFALVLAAVLAVVNSN